MTGFKNMDIYNKKIGIAGAGGLGSNCAFNLARSGFNNFKICDFDVVEKSNLNRQFYFYNQIGTPKVYAIMQNLKAIRNDINIQPINIFIDKFNIHKLFDDCDVIIEAFDRVEYKKLIIDEYADSDKLIVSASGIAGWGNFDKIKIKKLGKDFYIVGDFETEVTSEFPVISPKVNIIAAIQADIVLNYFKEEENK